MKFVGFNYTSSATVAGDHLASLVIRENNDLVVSFDHYHVALIIGEIDDLSGLVVLVIRDENQIREATRIKEWDCGSHRYGKWWWYSTANGGGRARQMVVVQHGKWWWYSTANGGLGPLLFIC
jgi:hypothetical protein